MPLSFLYNAAKDALSGVYTLIQSHNKTVHTRALLYEAEFGDATFNPYKRGRLLEQRIRFYIDEGADLDAKNRRGETALHLAVKRNLISIVKYLCEKGANIEAKNQAFHSEWTLTNLVLGYDIKKLFFSAIEDCGGKTPLHYAVMRGKPDIVDILCKKGANMEAKDDSGKTPRDYMDVGCKTFCDGFSLRDIFDENYNMFVKRRTSEVALEVARSTYSDLEPSHDMAFPDNMNSEYATQYAMGILSNLKFSPGAPNPIMSKILSYVSAINTDAFADKAQMLVAGRNALLGPKVEEASPTFLIKRKANYENEAKRRKLNTEVDNAAVEQEDERDLKRKPESQGGNSKRLKQ